MKIKKLFQVRYLKSLKLSRKFSVVVYPKVHVGISNSGTIVSEERLNLGKTWPLHGYLNSQLKIDSDANLTVSGQFDIMTGFLISVNEGANLTLGSGYMNFNCNIACFNKISIGNNVSIAENVTIRDSDNHFMNRPNYKISSPITIGNHVWIGTNATILKGVTIGEGSVIAAGAIVTKSIPSNCLAAGVPAKIIKRDICWSDRELP